MEQREEGRRTPHPCERAGMGVDGRHSQLYSSPPLRNVVHLCLCTVVHMCSHDWVRPHICTYTHVCSMEAGLESKRIGPRTGTEDGFGS